METDEIFKRIERITGKFEREAVEAAVACPEEVIPGLLHILEGIANPDLVDQLDACGFLRNLPKRPGMIRNIRHLFQRGEITEQELRTMHGVVTELAIGRRRRGRMEREDAEL